MQKENVLRKSNEKGARSRNPDGMDMNTKGGEEDDEDEDVDVYEDEWDSEGLEGDGEMEVNQRDEGAVASR